MIPITLTPDELRHAVMVGIDRRLHAIAAGRAPRYGFDGDPWATDIEGACCEAAVAKGLNRYWSPVTGVLDTHRGDVGRLQVRGSRGHSNCLILHPGDRADMAYILVTGQAPSYVLRGWLWGHEGKRQEYWHDPGTNRPAYFVPQERLRSMLKRPAVANVIELRRA